MIFRSVISYETGEVIDSLHKRYVDLKPKERSEVDELPLLVYPGKEICLPLHPATQKYARSRCLRCRLHQLSITKIWKPLHSVTYYNTFASSLWTLYFSQTRYPDTQLVCSSSFCTCKFSYRQHKQIQPPRACVPSSPPLVSSLSFQLLALSLPIPFANLPLPTLDIPGTGRQCASPNPTGKKGISSLCRYQKGTSSTFWLSVGPFRL